MAICAASVAANSSGKYRASRQSRRFAAFVLGMRLRMRSIRSSASIGESSKINPAVAPNESTKPAFST